MSLEFEGPKQETSLESKTELKILDSFDWKDPGVLNEDGTSRGENGIRGEKGEVYKGVVRYATQADREGIKAVEKDKWEYRTKRGERNYRGPDGEIEEPTMEDFDRLINQPDKFGSILLTIDGEVVAHVDFGENHLSEEPDGNPDSKTTELYTVTTLERYKRNGFMKRLLELAEKEVQKVFDSEKIILSTQEENPDAIAFYSDPEVGYEQLPGHFESQGEWKGKSPYYSVRFIKHLKKSDA